MYQIIYNINIWVKVIKKIITKKKKIYIKMKIAKIKPIRIIEKYII